jgi:hypothetical protein
MQLEKKKNRQRRKINQERKQQNRINNKRKLRKQMRIIIEHHVVIHKIPMIIMMIHGIMEKVKKVIYQQVIQMIKKYLLAIFPLK